MFNRRIDFRRGDSIGESRQRPLARRSPLQRLFTILTRTMHVHVCTFCRWSTMHDELRKLAAARMANEWADHTLQATALVDEAYVRLTFSCSSLIHSRGQGMR